MSGGIDDGYSDGVEPVFENVAMKNNTREYRKNEFCEAVKCSQYMPPSERHGIKGCCVFPSPGDCIKTAKEFHHWLDENGFIGEAG